MNSYIKGSVVKILLEVKNETHEPVTPSMVTVTLKAPNGATTDYTPSEVSVGSYLYEFDTTSVVAGTWWARGKTTNPKSATEQAFIVVDFS